MPAYAVAQKEAMRPVIRLFRQQRYRDAEAEIRKLIEVAPDWSAHHYNLAAVLARQGRIDAALQSLATAIDKGFTDLTLLDRDPDLALLRDGDRFQALRQRLQQQQAAQMRPPDGFRPAAVVNGIAPVEETNTFYDPRSSILITAFSFPERPSSPRVRTPDDPISRRLNLLYGERRAAGNYGDLYDNRDRGHSALSPTLYPQLSRIGFGREAAAAGLDYGINENQLFNAITIGNSSTALTAGRLWRSQARRIQTTPSLAGRAFRQYAADHLYVYPEHRDHDPERGDLFPANTPYMLISQGSSGSDKPFLDALATILAAFDPAVKQELRKRHLVMPTVQMVFRSGLKQVQSDTDYLSPKAHPVVFRSEDIDLRRMIFIANSLKRDQLPPRVDLAVKSESVPVPGVSYMGPEATDEILFNTPSAIARVMRSLAPEKRMAISTARTVDPNGHPLTFEWRLLQGDPDLVTIRKLKDDGSEVELRIRSHATAAWQGSAGLASRRIDIAVFAYNGFNYSAPALVSFAYPARQTRVYDRQQRLVEVDYEPPSRRDLYNDPLLFPKRSWRDVYQYADDGQLTGWTRIADGGSTRFTRDGALVTETDRLDRPVRARKVNYIVRRDKSGHRVIVAEPTDSLVNYVYRSETDRLGQARPLP
jgi:hypothetical protein